MQEKGISLAVIKRLPRYYRYLGDLMENGVVRISSKELSERMNVTASQIRQDLNNFGGFGGYNVESLYQESGKILGLDCQYNIIVIGAGNIGQALANYKDFERRGFYIRALFDVNPDLIGKTFRSIEVFSMDILKQYVKENPVDIAVITVPKDKACQIAGELADYGVKAFWNFAPTDLHLPDDVQVKNVHLAESLMQLSYNISRKK